jgi:DNA-directed RNA polymerase beta subunit
MRGVYNQIFVLKQKPGDKFRYVAETRSMSNETGHSILLKAMISCDDRTIYFSLPYIREIIPVGVVFKAMGYLDDEDIINLLNLEDVRARKYNRFIIRDSAFCHTQEDALKYIGQYAIHVIPDENKMNYAQQVVKTELLPHLGISGTIKEQAVFLGYMVKKLLYTNIGYRHEDDRDNYANKRVETAGNLLHDIFRNLFKKFTQFIKGQLEKRKQRPDILNIISGIKTITKGINRCMATGNWGVQKNAYIRTGVSQILDRMTYCATVSHLRRILIPIGKEAKNSAIRQIHSSSFGFVCPAECFDPETKILLWNGEIKLAKHIRVGDVLINDNGMPSRVKSTCFGIKKMYTIHHSEKCFEDYTVTDNHILTLKSKKTNHILDISIEEYQALPLETRNDLVMFKSGVTWPEKKIGMNPYTLGQNLAFYDSIPREYVVNSRKIRTQVVLGFASKKQNVSEGVKRDILFILNSLGMFSKDFSSFSLVEKPQSQFVGWQLEGNGRFLLGDFTVTHNTPEGAKIGVVLNFSLFCKVTKKIPTVNVRRILEKCSSITSVEDTSFANMKTYVPIFLNGTIIGFAQDPDATLEEIRKKRQFGLIDREVSVSYDIIDNDIKIFCDEGRFCRPLFTLTDNKLNIQPQTQYSWKKLIENDLVRYLDASEIENNVIAMKPEMLKIQQNDYCEIHPIGMLGIMASLIPFSDHSQSPRNCYQSSMGKQALGLPTTGYNLRTDTLLHILHYPQRPLVTTKIAQLCKINDMPSGINAIVAIACYTGFNQEDSNIVNLSSVQRGLFCITSYHTIDCCEKKRDTYSFEEICMPPETGAKLGTFRRKNANYSLLDKNGIIRPRTGLRGFYKDGKFHIDDKGEFYPELGPAVEVKKGDVLIGKVIVNGTKSGEETRIDDSVVVQHGEEGVIDRVHITTTPNGYRLVKIVIRVIREPVLGDKLASRSAQKSTIGMMYRQEDMPFTGSGITPDIIINPMCIPSRMTINQLIECVLGKECCISGQYGDVTPFTEQSVNVADNLMQKMSKTMIDYGFEHQGWEVMYNGMTGEQIQAKIFIGPTYYQRLKHMVSDKMHARARGYVTGLVRQPLEGRSKDGGLRFGEMERDAMLGHGNSEFLKERLFKVSDEFQICVCKKCGIMTVSETECQSCKGNTISKCNMPYASKLLHTELTALGLKLLIHPEEK